MEYLLSNCAFEGTTKFWKTQPDSGYLAGARTKPDRSVLGRHEAQSLLLEDDRPFDRRYTRSRLYTSPIIQGDLINVWSREKNVYCTATCGKTIENEKKQCGHWGTGHCE